MRYEALQVDLKNNDHNGPFSVEELSKFSQPTPSIKTASMKKKQMDHCHRRLPHRNKKPNRQSGPTS